MNTRPKNSGGTGNDAHPANRANRVQPFDRAAAAKLRITWLRYLRTYGWLTTLLLDARMFPLRGRQYPVMPAEGR